MKIQKGIVKYKDREDIVCTYGITDDNRQYYFLDPNDEKKFRNGNRIASKDLKEAIDPMVKASQIGVVDPSGNEVIPFVNRTIRPVNDDIILIEIANPVSQSVIDAIALKSDPSAATQLVSSTSTIKENLNKKMENAGRFIFNDMFSEATVCDINGNNLVNGEYFSFIGLTDSKLYFSKNTVDSEIVEYSILPPEVQSDITAANDTNDINVNNVAVPPEVVENALNTPPDVQNNVATPGEVVADSNVVATPPVEDAFPNLPVEPTADVPDAPVATAADIEAAIGGVSQNNDVGTEVENTADNNQAGVVEPENKEEEKTDDVAPIAPPVEEPQENVTVQDSVNDENAEKADVVIPPVTEDNNVEVDETPVTEENKVDVDVPPVVEEDNDKNEVDVPPVIPEEEDKVDEAPVTEDNNVEVTIPPVVEDEQEEKKPATISPEEVKEEVENNKKEEEEKVEEEKKIEVPKIPFSSVLSDVPKDVVEKDEEKEEVENTLLDKMVKESNSLVDDFDQDMQEDVFEHSDVKADKISVEDEFNDSYEEENVSSKDTIMADIAKSMSNLMRQNRDLKSNLVEVKTKLEKVSTSRRNIANKAKVLEQKNDILNTKLHNEETLKNKANAKVASLEAKVREQERIIASQTRELKSLRPQLQGKEDLVKLLADASLLLDDDGSYSSFDGDSSFR